MYWSQCRSFRGVFQAGDRAEHLPQIHGSTEPLATPSSLPPPPAARKQRRPRQVENYELDAVPLKKLKEIRIFGLISLILKSSKPYLRPTN